MGGRRARERQETYTPGYRTSHHTPCLGNKQQNCLYGQTVRDNKSWQTHKQKSYIPTKNQTHWQVQSKTAIYHSQYGSKAFADTKTKMLPQPGRTSDKRLGRHTTEKKLPPQQPGTVKSLHRHTANTLSWLETTKNLGAGTQKTCYHEGQEGSKAFADKTANLLPYAAMKDQKPWQAQSKLSIMLKATVEWTLAIRHHNAQHPWPVTTITGKGQNVWQRQRK